MFSVVVFSLSWSSLLTATKGIYQVLQYPAEEKAESNALGGCHSEFHPP